jgi:hypothetical protein
LIHRITLASNPRMLLLVAVLIVLPAAGVALFFVAGALLGILGVGVAIYLDYTLVRFLRNHLRSYVQTTDDELSCRLPDGETMSFPWSAITHAGACTPAKGRPFLFVYDSAADRLVSIPAEYDGFAELRRSLEEKAPFQELTLAAGETLEERLKTLIRKPRRGRKRTPPEE